jgi:hypothetical protein
VTALSAGQKDAFVTASWLKGADDSRELTDLLQPALSKPERSASRAQQLVGFPRSATERWGVHCRACDRRCRQFPLGARNLCWRN